MGLEWGVVEYVMKMMMTVRIRYVVITYFYLFSLYDSHGFPIFQMRKLRIRDVK